MAEILTGVYKGRRTGGSEFIVVAYFYLFRVQENNFLCSFVFLGVVLYTFGYFSLSDKFL